MAGDAHRFTIGSVAALDRDGIAASQTPGGAGNLTLNGVLASGGVWTTADIPRHVGIYSGSNIATKVFTVYGTDRFNRSISEVITGVNNSTVVSQKNFKTVTRVAVDAGTGAAVEVGTTGSFDTAWYSISRFTDAIAYTLAGYLDSTAALTWAAEMAMMSLASDDGSVEPDVFVHGTLTAKTATAIGSLDFPVAAVRFAVSGFTVGGARFYVLQAP